MVNLKNIITAYDMLRDDTWSINVDKLTDQQIDDLIDLQWDMLNQLPWLIAHKKQQAMIRLKAKNEEEAAETVINRIMRRLDIRDFDCEYWKVKTVETIKYDTYIDQIPSEYMMPNHASIRSVLSKWQKIGWVIPTHTFISSKIL